jgi:hypothetical protein
VENADPKCKGSSIALAVLMNFPGYKLYIAPFGGRRSGKADARRAEGYYSRLTTYPPALLLFAALPG